MATAAFDPGRLTAEASLNHVVLGSYALPQLAGRQAEEVCSRDALHALASDLGLPSVRRDRLADDLARALSDPDTRVARAAGTVLQTFGLRLGTLIATLRDPRTASRQGCTSARRAFLAYWLTVDSIWLTGGLLTGACGGPVLDGIHAAGAPTPHSCRIALAPYPAMAALYGAGRRAHRNCPHETVAVADLGHSYIKTATLQCSRDGRHRFQMLDRCRAPATRSAAEVEDVVTEALSGVVTKTASSNVTSVRLVVSVASFVSKGEPVDNGQGTYGCLAGRRAALRRRIMIDTGVGVDMDFVHDGTAAASAVTSPNSATITVGTWLGVGFQPIEGPPLLEPPPRVAAHQPGAQRTHPPTRKARDTNDG
jgi:hypothetical protein